MVVAVVVSGGGSGGEGYYAVLQLVQRCTML